jgi:hypothetical protein
MPALPFLSTTFLMVISRWLPAGLDAAVVVVVGVRGAMTDGGAKAAGGGDMEM